MILKITDKDSGKSRTFEANGEFTCAKGFSIARIAEAASEPHHRDRYAAALRALDRERINWTEVGNIAPDFAIETQSHRVRVGMVYNTTGFAALRPWDFRDRCSEMNKRALAA